MARQSFSKRFMPAPKNVAAFLVAVLAMLACVVSDIARRAPTPRRGKAIGVVDYKVDTAWLRDRGDAAGAKLADAFVQSKRAMFSALFFVTFSDFSLTAARAISDF